MSSEFGEALKKFGVMSSEFEDALQEFGDGVIRIGARRGQILDPELPTINSQPIITPSQIDRIPMRC